VVRTRPPDDCRAFSTLLAKDCQALLLGVLLLPPLRGGVP
jgi:hypothetical protein